MVTSQVSYSAAVRPPCVAKRENISGLADDQSVSVRCWFEIPERRPGKGKAAAATPSMVTLLFRIESA
ncbi:hypothetical protein B7R25_08980 [Subtercola boreus]|uniref:Uncharacterized protein n=1 Tax=Subtercola boreus TaxID=120213 RepID=A0A3E0WCF1_9MICO|nr:hypothetical protein B7R24_08915 [Subtercola boreus]RFA20659.1 hypothetical protein B7R23_08850 [Subtercola boreus]RFA26869.1 hypothetical protein B7R25_08980 [Subtercola boreus]